MPKVIIHSLENHKHETMNPDKRCDIDDCNEKPYRGGNLCYEHHTKKAYQKRKDRKKNFNNIF